MTEPTDQHALDPEIREFLRQAVESGVVWGLRHPDGWALSPASDDGGILVMPLWSGQEDAAACATDDWNDYQVESIALDALLEAWLPGLHEDGFRVGINWTTELEGVEVPPLELQADLEHAIEQLDPDDGDADAAPEDL